MEPFRWIFQNWHLLYFLQLPALQTVWWGKASCQWAIFKEMAFPIDYKPWTSQNVKPEPLAICCRDTFRMDYFFYIKTDGLWWFWPSIFMLSWNIHHKNLQKITFTIYVHLSVWNNWRRISWHFTLPHSKFVKIRQKQHDVKCILMCIFCTSQAWT